MNTNRSASVAEHSVQVIYKLEVVLHQPNAVMFSFKFTWIYPISGVKINSVTQVHSWLIGKQWNQSYVGPEKHLLNTKHFNKEMTPADLV